MASAGKLFLLSALISCTMLLSSCTNSPEEQESSLTQKRFAEMSWDQLQRTADDDIRQLDAAQDAPHIDATTNSQSVPPLATKIYALALNVSTSSTPHSTPAECSRIEAEATAIGSPTALAQAINGVRDTALRAFLWRQRQALGKLISVCGKRSEAEVAESYGSLRAVTALVAARLHSAAR